MEHCICNQVYLNSTRYEIFGDTVEFLLNQTKITFMFSDDCASLAATDLKEALLHPNPDAPLAQIGEAQLEALRKLLILFQSRLNKPCASPRVEQTSPARIARYPEPPRVDTPSPPRVA